MSGIDLKLGGSFQTRITVTKHFQPALALNYSINLSKLAIVFKILAMIIVLLVKCKLKIMFSPMDIHSLYIFGIFHDFE